MWVADSRAEGNKGSAVIKFSPEGRVLMTLGKPGTAGNPPEALTDPVYLVTDPGNGDVYVTESHTDVTNPNLVDRSRIELAKDEASQVIEWLLEHQEGET